MKPDSKRIHKFVVGTVSLPTRLLCNGPLLENCNNVESRVRTTPKFSLSQKRTVCALISLLPEGKRLDQTDFRKIWASGFGIKPIAPSLSGLAAPWPSSSRWLSSYRISSGLLTQPPTWKSRGESSSRHFFVVFYSWDFQPCWTSVPCHLQGTLSLVRSIG